MANTEARFLLTWEKAGSECEFTEIEINDIQTSNNPNAEDWYIFTYKEGKQEGCVDGAPKGRILTEAEKDLVWRTYIHVSELRGQARDLNAAARDAWSVLMRKLKEPEREV